METLLALINQLSDAPLKRDLLDRMSVEPIPLSELVTFDRHLLTLTLHVPGQALSQFQRVDLTTWHTPANILWTILIVARQPWCSGELLKQFIHAIEIVSRLTFTREGMASIHQDGRRLDWRAGTAAFHR